ncbi:Detected protein of unknown function [Hibiscus syriacus]|uniref:Glycine-rich protein n=1 Tax=Hibiscus syriacus TaxID=106335 RepID=A0A6A3ALU3_HIBSY|nr:Detected protein of unknown function [Hibiscus syriacus]
MGFISKSFILLALLFALLLLIISKVAARDLDETTTEKNNEYGKEGYEGYGGRGGYRGRGGNGGYRGRDGGYRGRGGYGRGCVYGYCRSYGKGCQRCCSYASEAVDVETHADPHNKMQSSWSACILNK